LDELQAGLDAGAFVAEDRIVDLERYGVADVPFNDTEALDSLREHDRETVDEIARLREEVSTRELEIAALRNRRAVRLADRARTLMSRESAKPVD
jgi:hypothetical protein